MPRDLEMICRDVDKSATSRVAWCRCNIIWVYVTTTRLRQQTVGLFFYRSIFTDKIILVRLPRTPTFLQSRNVMIRPNFVGLLLFFSATTPVHPPVIISNRPDNFQIFTDSVFVNLCDQLLWLPTNLYHQFLTFCQYKMYYTGPFI